jgi:hypothetical protein
MESVVNWTVLTGNRGADHGSLQAAQPDIRRIVATRSPQRHNALAGLAAMTRRIEESACFRRVLKSVH